jgi:hypothetical protein
MPSYLSRLATPLTLGLFAVSGVSGAALFFHFGQSAFHEMHEWLSMVLLAAFALHVWKNWPALVGYARRGALWLPLAASLVAAVAFALPAIGGGERGGSPVRAVAALTHAPLEDLAPILKTTSDALQAKLKQRGYTVASAKDTLETVAAASGAPAARILFDIMPTEQNMR